MLQRLFDALRSFGITAFRSLTTVTSCTAGRIMVANRTGRTAPGKFVQAGTAAMLEVLVMECQPRRAALIAATSIFFMPIIASNARFASSPPTASASVSTRGVICQETPHLSFHQPHALSWPPLPTMAFQ